MCTSYFIDNTKDDLYMASITRAVSSSGLANRMREKLGRPITTYGRVKPVVKADGIRLPAALLHLLQDPEGAGAPS